MRHDVTGVENLLIQQSQSININCVDVATGRTPLIWASIVSDDPTIVSTLLRHGADPNIACRHHGRTALQYACNYFNYYGVEILLKFNVGINCQSILGRTPLDELLVFYCSSRLHEVFLRCVRLLIDNHANVNIQDENGRSCLFHLLRCILEEGQTEKNLEMLRLLLNSSVDINLQLLQSFDTYVKGDTILHCAARGTNFVVVTMIMELCTRPNLFIQNSNNETAYDIAQQLHHKPIMKCLKMTLLLECHSFLRQKWIQM